MGIKGLWKLLEPARDSSQTLQQLAVREGYIKNPKIAAYRLGIDASIWIEEILHACSKDTVRRQGKNAELRELYNRGSQLLALCLLVVFVFDGPQRPEIKRNKKVYKGEHWMVAEIKRMSDAFGFSYHEAAGEAEAELALLNTLNIIDGVLTNDSDTVVFGATSIIQNSSFTRAHEAIPHVNLYRADANSRFHIAHGPANGMSRKEFVLLALLVGGDYDTAGIANCGPDIAARFAHYGLGEMLCNAVEVYEPGSNDLDEFLEVWRHKVRWSFRCDPGHHLLRREPSLADAIDDQFPNIEVVRNYLQPATSDLDTFFAFPPPQMPDVRSIARLFAHEAVYGGPDEIKQQFQKKLWPGIALRELMDQATTIYNRQTRLPWSGLLDMKVTSRGSTSHPTHVKISMGTLNTIIDTALESKPKQCWRRSPNRKKQSASRVIKLPATVVESSNLGSSSAPLPESLAASMEPAFAVPAYALFDHARGRQLHIHSPAVSQADFVVGSSKDVIDLTADTDSD